MGVAMFQVGSVRWGREVGRPEGSDGGWPLAPCGQHLDLQSVQGGRPQAGHGEDGVICGQDLGLRDDAVGQAVLSALRGHLRPCHLEAGHGLVEVGLGHLPGKVAGDVAVLDREGGRQVLGLGQHFGESGTCFPGAADVRAAFRLQGGARRGPEENRLGLRAALGPCGLHGHLIFAGKR